MNTCVRCGTQFARGDAQCPFCALPVSSDADVTRAGPAPGPGWQQQPPPGQSWQQGPTPQPWQQGGPPWQQGGPPWQQGAPMGGPPPSRGPKPAIVVGAAAAAVLVLGLGVWGITAAVSGDSDADPTAAEPSSSAPSPEAESSEPTEEPSESESTEESEATPGGDTEAESGGDDRIAYDLSNGEESFALDVTDPGELDISVRPDDDDDITLTINDPDGDQVCYEDAGLSSDDETCSFDADATGEYEIVVAVWLGGDGGQGEVVIE